MTIYKWKVKYHNRKTCGVTTIYVDAENINTAEKLAWKEFINMYGEAYTTDCYMFEVTRVSGCRSEVVKNYEIV